MERVTVQVVLVLIRKTSADVSFAAIAQCERFLSTPKERVPTRERFAQLTSYS
jgi:hypothetical protein